MSDLIDVPDDSLLLDVSVFLLEPDQVNRSEWTGRRKLTGLPGPERWTATCRLRPRWREVDKRPWRAFIRKLRGQRNHFHLRVLCCQRIGPNPTVGTGAGNGTQIPLTGMEPNSYHLRAGQYMTVPLPSGHFRLVELTEDLEVDATGNGTATFVPELNEFPAVGAEVETIEPFVPVNSTQSQNGWENSRGMMTGTLTLEEHLE